MPTTPMGAAGVQRGLENRRDFLSQPEFLQIELLQGRVFGSHVHRNNNSKRLNQHSDGPANVLICARSIALTFRSTTENGHPKPQGNEGLGALSPA